MKISRILGLIAALGFIWSCERQGDLLPNRNPDTKLMVDAINLTGDDRLNSVVSLSWLGTDKDGYVISYEVSLDGVAWNPTTSTDSTFRFTLDPGSDTTDIDLYVRAVDNEENRDESPAYLRIPLKNTPPEAMFDDESFPTDSTRLVTTFRWSFFDQDGQESVTYAFLKVNEGDWYQIDINRRQISLAPTNATQQGATSAYVYYDNNLTPLDSTINGLRLDDTNTFYLKVTDLANAESEVDTSMAIFVKSQESDLLVVSGQSTTTANIYREVLNVVYPGYDFEDFEKEDGINQPKFWSPTFDLILSYYDKLVFFGDGSTYRNPVNGLQDMLIGFAAPSIQDYSTQGGKSIVINTFSSNNDVSNITGVFPFDSLSSASGQAIFQTDSSLVATYSATVFPSMSPNSILLGMDPFYPTADATVMYRGQLEAFGAWSGPDVMGAGRLNQNNDLYQVFFTAPIYQFGTTAERETLFNQILNDEFNH